MNEENPFSGPSTWVLINYLAVTLISCTIIAGLLHLPETFEGIWALFEADWEHALFFLSSFIVTALVLNTTMLTTVSVAFKYFYSRKTSRYSIVHLLILPNFLYNFSFILFGGLFSIFSGDMAAVSHLIVFGFGNVIIFGFALALTVILYKRKKYSEVMKRQS